MLDLAIYGDYHTNLGVCANFAQCQALKRILNMLKKLNRKAFCLAGSGSETALLLVVHRVNDVDM